MRWRSRHLIAASRLALRWFNTCWRCWLIFDRGQASRLCNGSRGMFGRWAEKVWHFQSPWSKSLAGWQVWQNAYSCGTWSRALGFFKNRVATCIGEMDAPVYKHCKGMCWLKRSYSALFTPIRAITNLLAQLRVNATTWFPLVEKLLEVYQAAWSEKVKSMQSCFHVHGATGVQPIIYLYRLRNHNTLCWIRLSCRRLFSLHLLSEPERKCIAIEINIMSPQKLS